MGVGDTLKKPILCITRKNFILSLFSNFGRCSFSVISQTKLTMKDMGFSSFGVPSALIANYFGKSLILSHIFWNMFDPL